jgi:5-methylcytosine-specific restriction enzyme A
MTDLAAQLRASLAMTRKPLSTRERLKCFTDNGGICCLCGMKIEDGRLMEVHHVIELAAGGEDVPENRKPAHQKCHRQHTAKHSAPHIAKTRHIHQKHIGAHQPKSVMPGSRNSKWKRHMNGRVERR